MTLKDVCETYRRNLPPGELELFRVDPIDRVGIPCVAACLRQKNGTQLGTHGYGSTLEEAEVGALGEMTEFAFSEAALRVMPRETGSYAELVRRHGASGVMDPLRLCLPAGSPYHPDMSLTWVTVKRLKTDEPVRVPEEWVATGSGELRGRTPLITPITNGQGAGLTREQALAHGLLELLQRDGNGLQFRALDQGQVLDLDETTLSPALRSLLAHYRGLGIEVLPKLACADFGLVSLYVVGRDPLEQRQPMLLTACGEAADLDRERALRKALLEYAGSRVRKAFANGPLELAERVAPPGYLNRFLAHVKLEQEEPRALYAMADWARMSAPELRTLMEASVWAERARVPFSRLPTTEDVSEPPKRLALLTERLTQAGLDILVADLSPADHSVYSMKVIVPGLEVETMSYHRLGERGVTKLLARADPLAGLGTPPPGARPVRLTPEAEARLGGPAWFHARLAEQKMNRLYSLYREPERHAAQLLLRHRRFGGSP